VTSAPSRIARSISASVSRLSGMILRRHRGLNYDRPAFF
jgi:hypothetical protein